MSMRNSTLVSIIIDNIYEIIMGIAKQKTIPMIVARFAPLLLRFSASA
jgi:hypothetical protein